jgi:two-component system, OmpR family, sensor histidine kinase KdpD
MKEQPPDEEQREREEGRPDPEELLRRYSLRDRDLAAAPPRTAPASLDQEEDEDIPAPAPGRYPPRRGRLRVYLGAVAGAGNTYTMLEEMDTEAVIARHPRVALIDELAHTNVPGSKHAKRYQDVQEILDAGIDVVTTLNIQHLESLNDLVASITGVRVRETLPDWILDQAEEVELIDISPYALRQRMKHGNIYPPERIDTALNNFFRELALRRVAEKTESQLEQYMTEHGINERWQASEWVLVGFDARPHTREVIRDAWRLSHGLHADFIAVCIQPEGYLAFTSKLIGWLKYRGDAKRQREEALRRLEEHAVFAEDLGAEVIRASSPDIARKLVEIARERQVTQLVLGQPARSHWEELIRGSIINRLLRLDVDIDIHLVPRSREE